jgi:mono/diheme cytochrome c family protein
MKSLKLKLTAKIAAVAVLSVSGCFTLFYSAHSVAASPEVLTDSVAQASIYRAHCARCHGNDGRANTKEGRRTEADDLTTDDVKGMATDRMARIIRNGKGEMPSFGKKLSASQITSIIRYVRGL